MGLGGTRLAFVGELVNSETKYMHRTNQNDYLLTFGERFIHTA